MNASLLQHAGHSPLSVTRSRRPGHRGGSAAAGTQGRQRGFETEPQACSQALRKSGEARGLHCRGGFHDDTVAANRTVLNMAPSPLVFDRALLRRRRERAIASGPETFLLDRVAADIAERLGAVLRQFE